MRIKKLGMSDFDSAYGFASAREYWCDPWVGFRIKSNLRKGNVLNTDSIGHRFNGDPSDQPINRSQKEILISGGSFIFGSYASSDSSTIPAQLEYMTPFCVRNLGQPGGVTPQHTSLFYNYVLRHFKKPSHYIIVAGYNDFLLSAVYRKKYGQLILDMQGLANASYSDPRGYFISTLKKNIPFVQKLFVIRKLKSYFLDNKQSRETENLSSAKTDLSAEISTYVDNLVREVDFLSCCLNSLEIKFHYVLQPSILSGRKVLTPEEVEIPDRAYRSHLNKQSLPFYNVFNETLVSRMSDKKYFRDFRYVYDDVPETIFRDPVHVNDYGLKIFAEALSQTVIQ
jgi:hypothetical protein